jgi:hypothetical protein
MSGILINVQNTGTGFLSATEFASSIYNTGSNSITQQMDVQEGVLNAASGDYDGAVYTAQTGALKTGVLVQSANSGTDWTYAFAAKDHNQVQNFSVNTAGKGIFTSLVVPTMVGDSGSTPGKLFLDISGSSYPIVMSVGGVIGERIDSTGAAHFPNYLYQSQTTSLTTDTAPMQVTRTNNSTGGVLANPNEAILATATAGLNVHSQEAGIYAHCFNLSTNGGYCVGAYGHGTRQPGATGPIWGGVFEAQDNNSGTSAGFTEGVEVDLFSNTTTAADTGTTSSNVIAGYARRVGGTGAAMSVASGLLLSNSGDTGASMDAGIRLLSLVGAGLDTTGATPVAAGNPMIRFAAGQFFSLDASDIHQLSYVTGAAALEYTVSGSPVFKVTDAGNATAVSYTETLTTPSSSSATCTAGQFTDDANYHYVCVATNTWKRAALSSF